MIVKEKKYKSILAFTLFSNFPNHLVKINPFFFRYTKGKIMVYINVLGNNNNTKVAVSRFIDCFFWPVNKNKAQILVSLFHKFSNGLPTSQTAPFPVCNQNFHYFF